jgi:galactose mutarotase-like enzyme
MPTLTLHNDKNHLEISTFGSQILEWKHLQKPIFYTTELQKRSGMPLMFPFCGPLKNGTLDSSGQKIAQHGFGRNLEWEIVHAQADFVNLQIQSQNLPQEFQEAYPYRYIVDFFVKLEQNQITVSLNIENCDLQNMPIAPGFHPYFFVPQSEKDSLKIPQIPEFRANLLPWSTGVEAQFYSNPTQITIDNISGFKVKMTDQSCLHIGEETQKIPCDLMTIWAGEVADFVCIEPMSKRFNSINVDPILIPAGAYYNLEYTLEIG